MLDSSSPTSGARAQGRLPFLPCPCQEPVGFRPYVLTLWNMTLCRCLIEPSAAVGAGYKTRVWGRCYWRPPKGCHTSLCTMTTSRHAMTMSCPVMTVQRCSLSKCVGDVVSYLNALWARNIGKGKRKKRERKANHHLEPKLNTDVCIAVQTGCSVWQRHIITAFRLLLRWVLQQKCC